ncbi:MAG: methionyl-tRNA formyltransferase [Clostridia bacterium]|nr:methionyl-tRNA formyltransferase [Clostridia bacterium]
MRILFMGTPEFAVPCLKALIDNGHNVCGVITQPDKPQGRGHKLTPPPVKVLAEENNIEVFQPQTLKNFEFREQLERLVPEMIVVVAYGKILPEYILNFPKYGCINIHASLLPKYRGAGPIQWSVVNCEKKTGITSMLMEKGLDTGDMLLKAETDIGEYETAGELHDRLMVMGAELLLETVKQAENCELNPIPQNDAESTYAPMISKETALIDWSRSAKEVMGLVLGMNPWPVAHTLYKGESLKIYKAQISGKGKGKSGQIVNASENGIEVVCGDGFKILATEVQFAGSKRMSVRDYLNGHTIEVGEILV